MNPLATGGRTVPPEWIDYIGHMMDAYYFVAFTEATEAFLDHLGLGERYRTDSGCGIYTVESHLCFSKSVRAGAVLLYDSQLLGCDEKRLHVFHRMSQSPAGDVVATNELMFLHVDIAFTWIAVVLAITLVASPLYVRQAIAAFEAVDPNLVAASRTLGAGPVRTFFRVALPLARGGLAAGEALCLARSIGEFGATIMFAGSLQARTQTRSRMRQCPHGYGAIHAFRNGSW